MPPVFVVADQRPSATGYDKTSIAFAFPDDRPGHLYAPCMVPRGHQSEQTRITSGPTPSWEYIFLADMEGHDEKVAQARACATNARLCVLGSYPRDS